MIINVGEHQIIIDRTPVNEKEINITKCYFNFPKSMDGLIKDAYFTLNDKTYKVILNNNECEIPYEVLETTGDVEIGVVAYEISNDILIERFNPSPDYFSTRDGSLKDKYENSKPITPSDKEQIEQMLNNIQLGITKEGKITTITFTNKDGSTQTETLEDGKSIEYNWSGTSLGIRQEGETQYDYVNLKGDKGDAGSIKLIVVQTLPTQDIDTTAIYLVPSQTTATQNNYEEYVYINNQWEKLGEVPIETDLSDYYTKEEVNNLIPDLTNYVQFSNYATENSNGVIKTSTFYNFALNSDGRPNTSTKTYSQYQSMSDGGFIGKGTLENVITGKGLVSNTNYATSSVAGVIKTTPSYNLNINSNNGIMYCSNNDYVTYQTKDNGAFISKGTLENVLTARIGDIDSVLDSINGEVI